MNRHGLIALSAVVTGLIINLAPSLAQTTTFRNYHCTDGTDFIVGFYPYDSRAYVQIDSGSVMLPRRPAFSGARYSRGGVTLKITNAGRITVKRPKRSETACEVT